MIVGTAGHIDHGKTTLVRALTGVDTDRLPEEKKRGISIELGYAFMDAPGLAERIGFIDVPGHERLVHTMLAGATGIDYALLLVAADDGVMPQTREHLAVLSLLGLDRGAVLITKADRVDAERLQTVQAEVQALLHDTPLAAAPVLVVSASSGAGIAELKNLLIDAARQHAAHPRGQDAFRLAIDRAFTLDGVGTVVTGTVHAGSVQVGEELCLVPDAAGIRARVRSAHAQNRAVTRVQAGERAALALAGVAREQVQRGQWLTAPAVAFTAQRIDVHVQVWPSETRALRNGTAVHVHLGSLSVPGSVAVLDDGQGQLRDGLAPGESGRAQLLLRSPVGAWHGDRVVLRDASASRTVAGGVVLDPGGPVRYRRTPPRLAELDALGRPGAVERLLALLAVSPQGLDLQRHAAAQGLADSAQLLAALPAGALLRREAQGAWVLGADQRAAVQRTVLTALASFHDSHPEELGPDAARLRRLACPRLPDPLWRSLLADLQAQDQLQLRGAFVHLPAHGVRLSVAEERIAQKVAPRLLDAGHEGAWARDLARDCGETEALMRSTLARLAQRGELHQVVKDLYYPQSTMATLATIARRLAAPAGDAREAREAREAGDADGAADAAVTAAAYRDATGLGRKRAIQVLEYLDRIGLLRRVGDVHRLRSDSQLFNEVAA